MRCRVTRSKTQNASQGHHGWCNIFQILISCSKTKWKKKTKPIRSLIRPGLTGKFLSCYFQPVQLWAISLTWRREPKPPRKAQAGPEPAEQEGSANLKSSIGVLGGVQVLGLFVGLSPSSRSRNPITRFTRSWTWLCYLFGRVSFTNLHIHNFQQQRAVYPVVVEVIPYPWLLWTHQNQLHSASIYSSQV